jgi:polysaccharide export outer membrane protein
MVRPQEKRVIHVAGLVNTPNQFELPPDQDVRVLDAVAMAGGLKSPVADKIYIIRQMEEMSEPAVIEVSISRAKKNGNENLRLASGDLISVESTVMTNSVEALSTFFRVGLSLGGNVLAF